MNLIFGKYYYINDPYFYLIEWVLYWRDLYNSIGSEKDLIEFSKHVEDPFFESYKEDFIIRNKIKVKEWKARKKVSPVFGLEFAATNIQLTEFDSIKKCFPTIFETNANRKVKYNFTAFKMDVRDNQKRIDSQKKLESILGRIKEKKETIFDSNINYFFKEVINESLNHNESFEVALDRSPLFYKRFEPIIPDFSELLDMFNKLQEEFKKNENLSDLYDKYLIRYPFFALLIKTLITLIDDKFKFTYFLAPPNHDKEKFNKINGPFFVFKFSKIEKINASNFGQFCLSLNPHSPEIKFIFDQIAKAIKNKSHIKIKFYNSELIDKIGINFIYECFNKYTLKSKELDELIKRYEILSLHPSRNAYLKFNFQDFKTFLNIEDRLTYLFNTINTAFVLKDLNSKSFTGLSMPNIKQFIKNKYKEINIKPSFLKYLNSRLEEEINGGQELSLYLYDMELISIITPINIKKMLNYLNYEVEIKRSNSFYGEFEIYSKEPF